LKRHHGGTDHTEDTQRLLHRFGTRSSFAIRRLSAAAPGSRGAVIAAAARVPAAACGRRMRAGPSGTAVMASGRAGLPGGEVGGRGPVGHNAFRCNLSVS